MFHKLLNRFHQPKSVLFYRNYQGYSGGHQKVADYFNHLKESKTFNPSIAFSSETQWNDSNPWFPAYRDNTLKFTPADYDYLFLAGMDWQPYTTSGIDLNKPVVNFIQHVRHADATQDVYPFLTQKAVRICVSQEVSDAIKATGKVNGPVYTIANGHDMPDISATTKEWDFIIVGAKRPALAKQVYEGLAKKHNRICLIDRFVPRDELYDKMTRSRIAVLLPNDTEGFYLPALEAMKYCDLTVVPDCVGNRGFCLPEQNCFMPNFDPANIVQCSDNA